MGPAWLQLATGGRPGGFFFFFWFNHYSHATSLDHGEIMYGPVSVRSPCSGGTLQAPLYPPPRPIPPGGRVRWLCGRVRWVWGRAWRLACALCPTVHLLGGGVCVLQISCGGDLGFFVSVFVFFNCIACVRIVKTGWSAIVILFCWRT